MTIDKIWIVDNWINVDGLGRIGMYSTFDNSILLDYSMKFIVGNNDRIPCSNNHSDIKNKIMGLFN